MAGCKPCAAAAAAKAAAKQAQGKSTGKWSVTRLDAGHQGEIEFFDNKLAAMAFLASIGGQNQGTIRQVT